MKVAINFINQNGSSSVSGEDESHPLALRPILVLKLVSLFVLCLNMISECTLLDSSVVALSNLTGAQTGIVSPQNAVTSTAPGNPEWISILIVQPSAFGAWGLLLKTVGVTSPAVNL